MRAELLTSEEVLVQLQMLVDISHVGCHGGPQSVFWGLNLAIWERGESFSGGTRSLLGRGGSHGLMTVGTDGTAAMSHLTRAAHVCGICAAQGSAVGSGMVWAMANEGVVSSLAPSHGTAKTGLGHIRCTIAACIVGFSWPTRTGHQTISEEADVGANRSRLQRDCCGSS